jgi:hypothetical protein
MALDKYYLNLAGEYRVTSELFKRGLFATITYGNKKGADIYAIGPSRQTAVVEVKASNSSRFVTGFYQRYADEMTEHPDFWVLCSFWREDHEEFHVLSHAEMARAQAARNSGEALTWVENAEKVKTGVDNVLAKDLQGYKSAWNKIVVWCTADGSHRAARPTRRSATSKI